MQTPESDSETDYLYFPIEYTTMALLTVSTIVLQPFYNDNWEAWVITIDKSKFIDGVNGDHYASSGKPIVFNIISVGF